MDVGKATKGRRSRADARQDIIDWALDFLWDHPFRSMPVAPLMDQTLIGRSAFCVCFRDTHRSAETLLGQVRKAVEQATNPWPVDPGEPVSALVSTLCGREKLDETLHHA